MSKITFAVNDSFQNLTVRPSWEGSVTVAGASALIYTGSYDDYSASNPFSGPVTIQDSASASTESYILATYDVTATDTAAVGTWTISVRVTLASGEVQTFKDVQAVEVIPR